jgi:isoquinoline 1-oxidoreductase beta subunit
MKTTVNTQRRQFMVGAAGFTFGVAAGVPSALLTNEAAARSGSVMLNHWVTVFTDGTVAIMSPAAEMGQGSLTSLPRIVAEEMDADWNRVRVVPSPASDKIYGNPGRGYTQYTAGSATVSGYFDSLRQFGAQVRYVLLDNVARQWNVPLAELSTQPGVVLHQKTGRRITYGEIAAFAKVPEKAPAITLEPLATAQFRLIGQDTPRVDVDGKHNGTAQYSIDVQVPGMLHGAILREPVDGAGVASVEDSAARAVDGVVDVVRLKYGVGVLATSAWAAFQGRKALKVTWGNAATGRGFSTDKGLAQFSAAASNPSQPTIDWERRGDAAARLKSAATVVEAEYRSDYAYHAQMEPLNSIAAVSAMGDAVEIWCGVQSQPMAITVAAQALGIPESRVKINSYLLGGGFGRRGNRDVDFVLDSVLLSRAAGKPVKVTWTREDDIHAGRFRPLYVNRLRAGLDDAGNVAGWYHRAVCDHVMAFMDPLRFKIVKGRDPIALLGTEVPTYDLPDRTIEGVLQTTGMRTNPLRGIGFTANSFATEVFVDELAVRAGVDPVEFRLRLLKAHPRARHVIEETAKMADWGRRRPGRGLGVAYVSYSGTQVAGIAEVSVDSQTGAIRVHDFWCSIDCGVAVHPDNVVAQTEGSIVYGIGLALTERITIAEGAVEQSNFYDYHVPRMRDVPQMHIKLIQTRNQPTGAGQMAVPLVPSAISNAVFQLTGVRLRQQPMLANRVKQAMLDSGTRFG